MKKIIVGCMLCIVMVADSMIKDQNCMIEDQIRDLSNLLELHDCKRLYPMEYRKLKELEDEKDPAKKASHFESIKNRVQALIANDEHYPPKFRIDTGGTVYKIENTPYPKLTELANQGYSGQVLNPNEGGSFDAGFFLTNENLIICADLYPDKEPYPNGFFRDPFYLDMLTEVCMDQSVRNITVYSRSDKFWPIDEEKLHEFLQKIPALKEIKFKKGDDWTFSYNLLDKLLSQAKQ